MRKALPLLLLACTTAFAQVSCPNGFTTSGACGFALPGQASQAFQVVAPNSPTVVLSGTSLDLIPVGASHWGVALNYATKVNVQAFTASFSFVPDGWAQAFVLQNNTNSAASGGSGRGFAAGAGCEGGFYQGFTSNNLSTNNIFALSFSEQDSLSAGASNFTYSGVQIFSGGQSPCNPNLGGGVPYAGQNKISTSPVPLTLSTGNANGCLLGNGCSTTTGHTYLATITYDGSTVGLTLCDQTAGGACFTHSWPNVNIPALVGGTTAWLGITAGSGDDAMTVPLLINSLVYTAGSTPPPPAMPTFSPTQGTYTSVQTVTISDATSGAAIYYTTNGTVPSVSSTLYTGPITVSASEEIEAAAFLNGQHSGSATATYTINLPPPPVTLAIPAQSLPITITTAGTSISGTITIPAQTVTLPQQ